MALSDSERHLLASLPATLAGCDTAVQAIELLRGLSSEGQFYVPWQIDWEDPFSEAILWWLLRSERCDAATGLVIYWLNQSWDWLSVPSKREPEEYELRGYKLAAHIQERMLTYAFPSTRWSYDPRWHHVLAYPLTGNIPQHVSWLPPHMLAPTPGEPLASDTELKCW